MAETDEELWSEFGQWLQAVRHGNGLRRTAVAERAKLSSSTLQTLEKGGRMVKGTWTVPSPDDLTLISVARGYGIPVTDLFEQLGREAPDPFRQRILDRAVGEHETPVDDDELHLSAQGVDLAELAELDPDAYQQVLDLARFHLERARERRR